MDWQKVLETAKAVVDAHPHASAPELAQMLQAQFREVPLLGWFVLYQLKQAGEFEEREGEHG